MIAVIQRVHYARVIIDEKTHSSIKNGIVTLLGVEKSDTPENVEKLIKKTVQLRIFEDENGKMNRSLLDIQGEHLIVSQFTLAADCSSGRRPSFIRAQSPDLAIPLYEHAIQISRSLGVSTQTGSFQAMMDIELSNFGPATFVLQS